MDLRSIGIFVFAQLLFNRLPAQSVKKQVVIGPQVTITLHNESGKTIKTEDSEIRIVKPTGDDLNPNSDSSKVRTISIKPLVTGNSFTWNFQISGLQRIINSLLPGWLYLAAPGDSISIIQDAGKFRFTGKGAIKYQVMYDISQVKDNIANPLPGYIGRWISIPEFLRLNKYFDNQIERVIAVIDQNKSTLSSSEYAWIKTCNVYLVERQRLLAFSYIPFEQRVIQRDHFAHSTNDVANTWDSTMNNVWGKWLRSQNFQDMDLSYIEDFTSWQVFRRLNYIYNDTLTNAAMFRKYVYNTLKDCKDYKGLFRERALCYYLDEEISQELGAYNWFAQSILRDYYSQPGFSAYKNWVRSMESSRQYLTEKYAAAPLFEFPDRNGKQYSYKNLKGKFAVINFWKTGCASCKSIATSLKDIQREFEGDSNVVFLNISLDTDKTKWLRSIDEGIYTTTKGVHLYAGNDPESVKDFNVSSFPLLRLINGFGRIVTEPWKTSSTGLQSTSIQLLADLIRQQKLRTEDGPYVFYENNSCVAFTISGASIKKQAISRYLEMSTDVPGKKLQFKLQDSITIPASSYEASDKILVLSDIEGNFGAFRKLLQVNGVIDEYFNWIFGGGHLVFVGDMVDRGEQVTECLWLIYQLEEKARNAGGYVHFILGNHEIMNLNGQDRYVTDKYLKHYKLIGKSLIDIYDENSELGRWLRTKNIIEKIGNNLFTHGGISPQVNGLPLTPEQINALARPYYDKSKVAETDSNPDINVLFNERKSPFWYRHYYTKDYVNEKNNETIYHATEEQIDSTCNKFGIHHIITGHTIIADTITVLYNGKIINTDTRHAEGKSEALLIENAAYFRVTDKGKKILLFNDKRSLNDVAEKSTTQ